MLDGVLARRLGVATAALRRLDSVVDSAFYLAALFAAWRLHPEAIRRILVPLAALVAWAAQTSWASDSTNGREADDGVREVAVRVHAWGFSPRTIRVAPGQTVRFRIDAYPTDTFTDS